MGKHNSKTGHKPSMDVHSEPEPNSNIDMDRFCQFPLQDLPDDLLVEVFIRLPGKDLAKSCTRVCQRWYSLLKTQKLWKDKCIRRFHFPCDTLAALSGVMHADFKSVFFLNPYNRNLIQNPDASEGLSKWNILRKGGQGFAVEKAPVGSDPVADYAGAEYEGLTIGCWATSYGECRKEQIIDLIKEGCSEEVLDNVRPDINISEWYAARFDCGIVYSMKVQLLSTLDKGSKPIDSVTFEDEESAGRNWYHMQHTFSNYKPGVRYIRYRHGGQDRQFWAGHYGVKFTLSSVKFDLNHTAGPEKH